VRLGRFLTADDVAELAATHDAVILATGLGAHRQPAASGAQLPGVEQGAAFLREAGSERGRSVAGRVVVIGGDETALDCARTALRCGASHATVVHGGPESRFESRAADVDEAVREGVSLLHSRDVESIGGGDRVRGVVLAELAFGEDGTAARTERRDTLAADLVLVATEREPAASCVPAGWTIEDGTFRDGDLPLRVFAAGDCTAGVRSIAHAVGDGRRAALRALAAAGVALSVPTRRDPSEAVRPADIRFDHYAHVAPAQESVLPLPERFARFDEVRATLDDASEAKRCLSCGKCTQCDSCLVYCPEGVIHRRGNGYVVDVQDCKGCGVCVAVCPRCAMEMSS
jgi:NADPH-dependent glutamate synthase beta subunit-like oxidoreductase